MTQDVIDEFVKKWSLDSGSVELLQNLQDGLLKNVVETFDPPSDTRNIDAKLKVFVQKGCGKGTSANTARHPWHAKDSSGIKEFSEKWGLDEGAVKLLEELDPAVCASVFAEFNPPPDTQNINARLQSFVKSRARGASQSTRYDVISDFVAAWGLDSVSEALLRGLSSEVLDVVIQEFAPKPGTLNLSGKLTAFVRNVERRVHERGYSDRYSNGSYHHHASLDVIGRFVTQWGLDPVAEQALRELPASVQESVIGEFDPPPGTANPSGKLMAFIRARSSDNGASIPGRRRHFADRIASFIQTWQLDTDAEQLIRSVAPNMQEDLMQSFQPRADTRNYSARFQTFARARLAEMNNAGTSRKRAFDDADASGGWSEGSTERIDGRPDVTEFVHRWGLDDRSENLLLSLSEDVLTQVIAQFQPDEYTRNPNAKLASWVKSLQDGGTSSRDMRSGSTTDDVNGFVRHWGLDEKSESLLRSLSANVLLRVMSEFQPDENTRNMNAKLASWIRAMGSGSDQPARKWPRTQYC